MGLEEGLGPCGMLQYLDGGHQGEVPDKDDAKLRSHVLHDGPALIAQT